MTMTPQDLVWPSPVADLVWPSPVVEAVLSCNHLDNDVIDLTPGVDYSTPGELTETADAAPNHLHRVQATRAPTRSRPV